MIPMIQDVPGQTLSRHSHPDPTKMLQGDVNLNVQRVDFRDGNEMSLVKRILAGTKRPRHHDTIDRAADNTLIEDPPNRSASLSSQVGSA
jgi:hypothetical protein